MMTALTKGQISHVLQMQVVGRIGIMGEKSPYVVPVSYVYDGKDVYAHSKTGLKIQMMRRNANVCFQVDIIDSINVWRSVILTGQYEELKSASEIQRARKLLDDRFAPMMISDITKRPGSGSKPPLVVEKKENAIFFKIKVAEMTGRYEIAR